MAVLIVAEKDKGAKLGSLLHQQGFPALMVQGWEEALAQLEEQSVNLVLLALSPAQGDATEMRKRLRQMRDIRDIPLLLLLPEENLEDRELLWGPADFILEPYRPAELVARLRRLLGPPPGEGQNLLVYGDLVIDPGKYQVFLGGLPVVLTFKEFELLKFLAAHRGQVFSREALLNQVWGYQFFGGERTVDVHIRRLRSKLEDRHHSFIETVRHVGYRFKE